MARRAYSRNLQPANKPARVRHSGIVSSSSGIVWTRNKLTVGPSFASSSMAPTSLNYSSPTSARNRSLTRAQRNCSVLVMLMISFFDGCRTQLRALLMN